jgi:hypothetical protein
MPPLDGRAVPSELGVEVDVDRAGQVPLAVGGAAVRPVEPPPDVEQAHRSPAREGRVELGGGHEGMAHADEANGHPTAEDFSMSRDHAAGDRSVP